LRRTVATPALPSAHTSGSIHGEEHRSPKGKNMNGPPKEAHNGRQRRQKRQREGPETEGNQTGKRSKREEGQTTEKRTEIVERMTDRQIAAKVRKCFQK